jgi:transposase
MAKRKQQSQIKKVSVNALAQVNLNAAGIDIGANEIYVAVPEDRVEENVRKFGTFTCDLRELGEWLRACGVTMAAMEATGVYWVPLFEILEEMGFTVYLVNARHLKNVSGRKTDVLDCQWLQQLLTYGLLNGSFRPPEHIVAIRSLVRHRSTLVEYRSRHILHMQKALTLMNLRLTTVLSDITGVSGMRIIQAILAGERDPQRLAALRTEGCKRSEEDIAKALTGHYRDEQVFLLRQAVEMFDIYTQKMHDCDAELEALYSPYDPPEEPVSPPPVPSRAKPRKNQANFDLDSKLYNFTGGINLIEIDGVEALTIQKVISETGTDMSKWPTVKHFTSWLRLCPNNKITGGKIKKAKVQPGQNRASNALRLAASTLAKSQTALGAFFRRIQSRHGKPCAITATAHKLARIIYFMLKYRKPYQDVGPNYLEEQYRERLIQNLNRRAKSLGFRLEPVPSAPAS